MTCRRTIRHLFTPPCCASLPFPSLPGSAKVSFYLSALLFILSFLHSFCTMQATSAQNSTLLDRADPLVRLKRGKGKEEKGKGSAA